MARIEEVRRMFNHIAPRYDLLNHLLSANIDRRWRRRLIDHVEGQGARTVLDVATGTADLAILAARRGMPEITGIDIAEAMLDAGQKKVDREGLSDHIRLLEARAEALPFGDGAFDAVMVAFGVRNFENLELGLLEMYRVTRAGGSVAILEFSTPRAFPLRQLYLFYFRHLLPVLGRWVSGVEGAYHYLPDTVLRFPQGTAFVAILEKAGYRDVAARRLSGGIATLYIGRR